MRANRKELALLRGKRTPETLADWAKYFGEGDREKAQRYALAVATFLGQTPDGEWADYLGQLSPNTRKAYAYAVTEFFEWIAAKYDRVVPPHRVVRKDAEDYVNWLANRPFSLAEEKLKDGDMQLSLQIFDIVKKLGSTRIRGIANELPSELALKYFGKPRAKDLDINDQAERAQYGAGRRELSRDVRHLITLDVLTATPTIEELRRDHPQAGITQWTIGNVHYDEVFTYSVREYKPVSRTTVALRIAALSQFWKILMQGENIAGGQSILQYDIWEGVKKRVNRGISPEKRRAAREQKVPTEVVLQMLERAPNKTLVQLRNRAILYLLVFTGLRTTELIKLRRAKPSGVKMPYFDGTEPPALQVLRKGNKWMKIPYPPVALKPLIEFQAELEKRAQEQVGWGDEERRQLVELYQLLQLPDAPLFPSIGFWGANTPDDYRKSMSRINLYKLLQKIAEETGVPPELVSKVHPHAIRHFSANAMAAGGKDLREIQHLLGHTSITTTEGYLEDIEEEVKLSGQAEILDFLQARGVRMQPPADGKPKKPSKKIEVIDTYATDAEDDSDILDAEFEDIAESPQTGIVPINTITLREMRLVNEMPEQLPDHDLPKLPEYKTPEVRLVDTKEGEILVEGDRVTLIGIAGEEEPEKEQLIQLSESVVGGVSPGSPDEVYEVMSDKDEAETVVFNRGGQRDKDWLLGNYPKMPKDFGLGRQSLLPWYTKAKGNVSRSGFYQGVPPYPLWSYVDQTIPTSARGKKLLSQIEELYMEFTYGNADKNVPPSPIRGVGLIRWFGFFSFFATRFHENFKDVFEVDRPRFVPFEQEVKLGREIRMHKDEWLIEWLKENSHTFRSSVDAMKRGVPRGQARGAERENLLKADRMRDPEQYFLKASFEGIDLVKKMPKWMVEDDPINAMWQGDPGEFERFSKWIKNVTGQALSKDRSRDKGAAEDNTESTKERIRDMLVTFYEARDQLIKEVRRPKSGGKKKKDEEDSESTRALKVGTGPDEYKFAMRNALLSYYLIASGSDEQSFMRKRTTQSLLEASSKDFQNKMDLLFEEAGIPNPNDTRYRGSQDMEKLSGEKYKKGEGPRRVKDRITLILRDLFPGELDDVNVFADSELFDPAWFRVDTKNHTIYIEEEAAEQLKTQYGIQQDIQLLLRRAARAMWESREKGYDKLWGVMMSYLAWIVPTGVQMEQLARGIQLPQGMQDSRESRLMWLEDYTNQAIELADGTAIRKATEKKKEEKAKELERPPNEPRPGQSFESFEAEWRAFDEQEAAKVRARSGDVMDYAVIDGDMAADRGGSADLVEQATAVDDFVSFASVEGIRSALERGGVDIEDLDFEELAEQTGLDVSQIRSILGDEYTPNRTCGMSKNGRNLYMLMEGEVPQYWYRVKKSSTSLTPNVGAESFVSPAVIYNTQKRIMPAMTLLPSPFRMMSAMELE